MTQSIHTLQSLLKQVDATQSDLAQACGVSKAAISRQMNSDGDIKVGTLAIIARALGREVEITLRKSTPPASGQ